MPKTTTGGASNATAGPGESGYTEPEPAAEAPAGSLLPEVTEEPEPAPEPEPPARDGGGRFAAAADPEPEPVKKNGSPAPAPVTGSGGVALPKPAGGS